MPTLTKSELIVTLVVGALGADDNPNAVFCRLNGTPDASAVEELEQLLAPLTHPTGFNALHDPNPYVSAGILADSGWQVWVTDLASWVHESQAVERYTKHNPALSTDTWDGDYALVGNARRHDPTKWNFQHLNDSATDLHDLRSIATLFAHIDLIDKSRIHPSGTILNLVGTRITGTEHQLYIDCARHDINTVLDEYGTLTADGQPAGLTNNLIAAKRKLHALGWDVSIGTDHMHALDAARRLGRYARNTLILPNSLQLSGNPG